MYINALGIDLAASAAYNNYTLASSGYQTRLGTDKNDIFHSAIGDVMKGGKGDDSYYMWSPTASVVEKAGEGIDTMYIQYWGVAVLPDNVENLTLVAKGAVGGTGNALDNIITAGVAGATLNGKAGNDVLVGGAGADVFVVEKGNGSDVILNFQPGKDAVLLQGYGFSSFSQIQAAAVQSGADVKIALGGGEVLIMRGTSLSGLHAADFGLLEASQIRATSDASLLNKYNATLGKFDPTPITLSGAGKAWNANGWYVVNNMWGSSNLKEGVDYTVNSTFSRGDMTSGVTFNWSVPYTTAYAPGIKGYPEVGFGVAPKGNYAKNPTDTAFVFPVKVADLSKLIATYDVSWSGTTSGFNVSYDIWLTSKPNGGPSTITNEVMVWVHKGSFDAPGDKIGTFTQDGVTGSIYHTGTYTAVVLDKDVPAGKLDVTALLAKLQALGVVSPSEYLASIELGAEMVSGVGSLTINNLDLTVVSRSPNGTLVTKEVTGAGTTVSETPLLAQKFAAGTAQLVDEHGMVTGSKVTRLDANDAASVQFLDKAGKLVGSDIVKTDAAGSISTQHFNAAGKLTGVDVVKTPADWTNSTEHYDANWKFTGADSVKTAADGSTSTYHFDANWKLQGVDTVKAGANGTTSTYHYDGNWNLQSVDSVQVQGGKTTTTHYDAKWAVTGIDMKIVDANGNLSVQHLDKNWKLLSAENVVANADGSTTTTHYNASWGVTGYDVDKHDAAGVTFTTHYNAKWQVTSLDYVGTGSGDTLTGGWTTSNLHGGRGSDTLVSGTGATNFWFDTAIGNGDVDQVSKFSTGKDGVYLSQSIFSGIKSLGDLSASAFAVGTAATSADTRIIFDKATGNLFYDADGTGAGAAILFAHVDADKALTAANFHVVA